jgi:hypothetical protein
MPRCELRPASERTARAATVLTTMTGVASTAVATPGTIAGSQVMDGPPRFHGHRDGLRRALTGRKMGLLAAPATNPTVVLDSFAVELPPDHFRR